LYNCTVKFGASVILTGYVRFFFCLKKRNGKEAERKCKEIPRREAEVLLPFKRSGYTAPAAAAAGPAPKRPRADHSVSETGNDFLPWSLNVFFLHLNNPDEFSKNITVPGTLYPPFFSPAKKF
jgi:hypothetical protein